MTPNLARPSLIAFATLVVCLAGCGGSGATTSGAAGTTQAPGAAGTTVAVTETEFHIALGAKSLKPGTYTFEVHNAGSITHALTVVGPGVSSKSTGDIAPGSAAALTVTLGAGSFELYCPVGNHKMEGMDEKLTVE